MASTRHNCNARIILEVPLLLGVKEEFCLSMAQLESLWWVCDLDGPWEQRSLTLLSDVKASGSCVLTDSSSRGIHLMGSKDPLPSECLEGHCASLNTHTCIHTNTSKIFGHAVYSVVGDYEVSSSLKHELKTVCSDTCIRLQKCISKNCCLICCYIDTEMQI